MSSSPCPSPGCGPREPSHPSHTLPKGPERRDVIGVFNVLVAMAMLGGALIFLYIAVALAVTNPAAGVIALAVVCLVVRSVRRSWRHRKSIR